MTSPGRLHLDLNLDAGEDPAALEDGREERLYGWVSRVNIACGGHAGDPDSMKRAVELAVAAGVAIGAHPSFPDREHFGRERMELAPDELESSLVHQIRTLKEICVAQGARLEHVKAHGALYHEAVRSEHIAKTFVEAVKRVDPALVLVGQAASEALELWRRQGFVVMAEGFADRRYRKDGTLVPRSEPTAVIEDPAEAAHQAWVLWREGKTVTVTGETIFLRCHTLCVHGDNPRAEEILATIRGGETTQ